MVAGSSCHCRSRPEEAPLVDMFYAGLDLSRRRVDVCAVDRDGVVVAEMPPRPTPTGSLAWLGM